MRRFVGRLLLKAGLRVLGFRASRAVVFESPDWGPPGLADWAARAVVNAPGPARLNVIYTADAMTDEFLARFDAIWGDAPAPPAAGD